MSNTEQSNGEVRQVLVHPLLIARMEVWLAGFGFHMRCIGSFGDDLPCWVIEPIARRPASAASDEEDHR